MTAAQKALLCKNIDNILWNDWDPIGINSIAPRNEYQSYVLTIYHLLMNEADKETIAEKLYEIETIIIALPGSIDVCRQVADKLINLNPRM